MTQIFQLSAVDARQALIAGEFSAVDYVRACLDRIAEREAAIGAWAHLDHDLVLHQAQKADEALRAGHAPGPLHGIPVGIKDIIDTAGLPTEHGTAIFAGRRPDRDAEVVRRLYSAGAIVLGKTVTTELAFFGPGKPRNPADRQRTPGGSSSGSAAAVADFHVPLALGSQTAGSILRPASYCGVIGMKPSFGLIPLDGVLSQSPPLDTLGGYARSVEDVALLVSVLAGVRLAAPGSRMSGRPLKLAFIRTAAWADADAALREAFETFAKTHDDFVEDIDLPDAFAAAAGLQRKVQFRDIAQNYGPLTAANPNAVSDKLKEVIAEGRIVRDDEYAEALALRDPLRGAIAPIFERFDAILTPAAPGVAPLGLTSTGSPMFNFLWT